MTTGSFDAISSQVSGCDGCAGVPNMSRPPAAAIISGTQWPPQYTGSSHSAASTFGRSVVAVLSSMIAKTIFAISMEESRFTLNGALLVLKKGSLAMVATDGHRLAMVESSSDLPGVTGAYRALLPRKAMAELQKLAADATPDSVLRFAGDENHLFFELGGRMLLSRKLTGNFPDFERVLPKEHAHSVSVNRDEFRGAVASLEFSVLGDEE